MRSWFALWLVALLALPSIGCGRRRGGGGGDDDDDSADGDADGDGDVDVDGDADADADGDADDCSTPDRDLDDHPAIACGGDDCDDADPTVHPGAPDSSTWSSDMVWDTSVYYPSVTVDSTGVAHAAFTIYDSYTGNASLGYASNIGGVWVGAEIVSGTSTGWMPSIAVDGNGDVHIAYYESSATSTVYYVTNATGQWVTRNIGPGYGQALTVDAAGHVYLAYTKYVSSTSLVITSNAGGAWASATIDDDTTSTGYYPEIALDHAGHAHVAYVDYTSTAVVKYATNASGPWTVEQVATGGGDMVGLAVDAGDAPHITYGGWDVNGTSLGVRHATNATGGWVSDTIDATGIYSDLVIDARDVMHVVYTDSSSTSVRYASNPTGAWSVETIANGGGSLYYPDIALGGGELHVVYQGTGAAHVDRAAPDRIDQDCNGVIW